MLLNVEATNNDELYLLTKDGKIVIKGSSTSVNPGEIMKPFFINVHNNIIDNKLTSIQVDIKELTFLNSSGIKEIVNWILKLEQVSYEDRYKINFIYNSEVRWQEAFVSSMVYLNSEFVGKQCSW